MDTASEYDLVKQGCNIFSAAGSQIANGTQTFEVNHLKFRILSIHHRIQPHDYRSNEHEHPNYEISFMRTGSMVTTCESSKIRADVNDNRIFFVPPLTLHSRVFGPDPINVNETIMFMITDNDETGRSPIQILPMLIQKKKYSFPFSPELQTLWKLLDRKSTRLNSTH